MSSGRYEGFLVGVILASVVCAFAHGCDMQRVERKAIDAGVAEYYLDANHAKQFRYKTNGVTLLNTQCLCK